MASKFQIDLQEGQKAEKLVKNVLQSLTNEYRFEEVGMMPGCFKKGDVLASSMDGRKQIFIEVKNDNRIAETQNLLCEEAVYFYSINEEVPGNFYSDYEVYAVVSAAERKIYFMDFSILKQHYKSGEFKEIKHREQITYCYLCPLGRVRSWGAMIAEISY